MKIDTECVFVRPRHCVCDSLHNYKDNCGCHRNLYWNCSWSCCHMYAKKSNKYSGCFTAYTSCHIPVLTWSSSRFYNQPSDKFNLKTHRKKHWLTHWQESVLLVHNTMVTYYYTDGEEQQRPMYMDCNSDDMSQCLSCHDIWKAFSLITMLRFSLVERSAISVM